MNDWLLIFRENPEKVMTFRNYECYAEFSHVTFGQHMNHWDISPYSIFVHKKDDFYWYWPSMGGSWPYTIPRLQDKFKMIDKRWAIRIPSDLLIRLDKTAGVNWS